VPPMVRPWSTGWPTPWTHAAYAPVPAHPAPVPPVLHRLSAALANSVCQILRPTACPPMWQALPAISPAALVAAVGAAAPHALATPIEKLFTHLVQRQGEIGRDGAAGHRG